jgi:hypothetical protein
MTEPQEGAFVPTTDTAVSQTTGASVTPPPVPEAAPLAPQVAPESTTAEVSSRHAEAGRKGARRILELVEFGKLYEQEHGLKRGRQRRRQLIELGKLYEQEHGLRPRKKRTPRLPRMARDELLTTLLQCLIRLARPSFRAELARLVELLQENEKGQAA